MSPVFLVGAMAPFVSEELRFGPQELGVAVAAFFAVSAVASLPAGRFVGHVGSYPSAWCAGAITVGALLGIGIVVSSWAPLVALMAVGGIGNAAGQLSTNLSLARAVPTQRQGLAFGIKQAAVPFTALLGGLAVPVLALNIGWRWAFVLAPILLFAWAVASPRVRQLPRRFLEGSGSALPRARLVVLAFASVLAGSSASALGTFVVASMVASALSPALAGSLLALGSGAAIASRVIVGWRADHIASHPFTVVAAMMAAGALGITVIGTGQPILLLLGLLAGFGAGWGWNGLLHYAIVRENPDRPAEATGVTQVGLFVGGVLGPLLIGGVIAGSSYQAAWALAGGMMFLAAALVYVSRLLTPAAALNPAQADPHASVQRGPEGRSDLLDRRP